MRQQDMMVEAPNAVPRPSCSAVEDVMTRKLVTVGPGTSVQMVRELLLMQDISGVPVVSEDGVLLGVVSKTDLVRAANADDGDSTALPAGQHLESTMTADDLMAKTVMVVEEGAPLSQVAQVMARAGVHRLPVISRKGKLVGIVTSMDLVRWLAGLP